MKKTICIILIIYIFVPFSVFAAEKGSVYLGPFLSVVWYDPGTRPYITIGEYGPFHFKQGNDYCALAVKDLDLNKRYKVKVHFNGEVVRSWNLDFNKTGSSTVCIWRDKGAWRMEPVESGKCDCRDNKS